MAGRSACHGPRAKCTTLRPRQEKASGSGPRSLLAAPPGSVGGGRVLLGPLLARFWGSCLTCARTGVQGGPAKVHCLHILKKHTGSRNPKVSATGEVVQRSKEDAIALIKGAGRQGYEAPCADSRGLWLRGRIAVTRIRLSQGFGDGSWKMARISGPSRRRRASAAAANGMATSAPLAGKKCSVSPLPAGLAIVCVPDVIAHSAPSVLCSVI